MMSDKIIELRRALAEKIPNWRDFRSEAVEAQPVFDPGPTVHPWNEYLSKGGITELVCSSLSSGSALLVVELIRQVVQGHKFLALIDGLDTFDPAHLNPQTLSRLLWVRCQDAVQAVKAADILLRDRNVPLVVLDLRMNPAPQLRKVPASIWYRLQRIVKAGGCALLVLSPRPLVGSANIRLQLEARFNLTALQQREEDLLPQLKLEISRHRLHIGKQSSVAS